MSRPCALKAGLWVTLTAAMLFDAQAAAGAPAPNSGPTPDDPHVTMQIMPGVRQIIPGATFVLGVDLRIQDQWHIYWLNPGDTGIPTELDVSVPDGFKVKRIMYPAPERIEPGDGTTVFGYEKQVMMLVEIQAPADPDVLGAGVDYADFNVHGDWLVCKQACLIGNGDATTRLKIGSIGDKPGLINQARLAKWRDKVPVALSALGKDAFTWSGTRARPTLSVPLHEAEDADYFPLATNGVEVIWSVVGDDEDQDGRRFEAIYEIENPSADPAPVLGVLKIETRNGGVARYYEVVHALDE